MRYRWRKGGSGGTGETFGARAVQVKGGAVQNREGERAVHLKYGVCSTFQEGDMRSRFDAGNERGAGGAGGGDGGGGAVWTSGVWLHARAREAVMSPCHVNIYFLLFIIVLIYI